MKKYQENLGLVLIVHDFFKPAKGKIIFKHLLFILYGLIYLLKCQKEQKNFKSYIEWTFVKFDKPHPTEMKACVFKYTISQFAVLQK